MNYYLTRLAKTMMAGTCLRCSKPKQDRQSRTCNKCTEEHKKYLIASQESRNFSKRLRRYSERQVVLKHYGKKCVCCGEKEDIFLTIDHVDNDGAIERRRLGSKTIYKSIIQQDFPDHYRILCFNCNCGRAKNNGICPHQERKWARKQKYQKAIAEKKQQVISNAPMVLESELPIKPPS